MSSRSRLICFKTIFRSALLVFVLFVVGCRAHASPSETMFRTVADIPLPGGTYRFDYQSLDVQSGRLYLSHMRANELIVFDTKQNRIVANLPNFRTVTGVLYVSELRRVYASLAGTGEVAVLDVESLKEIARIPTGRFPDGLAYYPPKQKLFVSDESGGTDVVIDTKMNKRVATIPLGGGVGNTIYDPSTKFVYATVGDTNELVSINPETNEVADRYPLLGSSNPHGLYIEPEGRLAFIACEGNDRLLVFDLKNKTVTSVFPVGDGPDVLAFDAKLKRLYVASESGTLSVFDQQGFQLIKKDDLFIEHNAHTISVDPESHRIYMPLKDVGGVPVLRILEPKITGTTNGEKAIQH